MAGKTFPGIGDLEDEVPPLDPADAADSLPAYTEAYSGPTVVDDAKVEQGAQEAPLADALPGPNTGIHRAVTDALTDGPRVTPQVPITVMPPTPATPRPAVTMFGMEPARDTTLGRNVVEPSLGQQAALDDKRLRGTLFGHDTHMPDLDIEAIRKEIETSKALAVVQRGQPTTNEIAIFQPGPYAHQERPPLGAQTPYPRFQRTPIEVHAEPARGKVVTRIAMAAVGIALVVGAALLWLHSNGDEGDAGARSGSGLLAPAPRLMEPPPAAAPAPAAPPAPAPAAAAPAPAEATPPPAAPAETTRPKAPLTADDVVVPPPPQPAPAPAPAPAHRSHPTPHADRHRVAPAAPKAADTGAKPARAEKPDDSEAPAPPRPAHGKRGVEEDPDATMAPTIE